MKKHLVKMSSLLLAMVLSGCYDSNAAGHIAISSTLNPDGQVNMGNIFTFTASLTGSDVGDQTITATSTEPNAVITSIPSTCTINATGGITSCTFTVATAWNTNLPNNTSVPYVIQIKNSGDAALGQSSINYSVVTPTVYLPQTGSTTEVPLTGLAWPNPRFTVSGACVTDNLTGLMWLKDANYSSGSNPQFTNPANWSDANTDIVNLNNNPGVACGYTDWRLPTINELRSLVNYGENSANWLNGSGFEGVRISYFYWSSTDCAPDSGSAWNIDMSFGRISANSKTSNGYAWPVRGGQ